MIYEKRGNLLNNTKGYIVHGCNAQGVMGSGVAKQIKYKWPRAYKAYITSEHKLGEITYNKPNGGLTIINAVTQEYYGRDPNVVYVDYNALKECFIKIKKLIKDDSASVVLNFPLIGCGFANGDWEIVSKIIDEAIPDDVAKKVLWRI